MMFLKYFSGDDTIELTDKNFKKLVLQNDNMWLVKFFDPSCRHCQRLEPDWKIAASELKGRVNLGMIDITENPKLAHKYGIQEVPTIKYFSGSTFHAEGDYLFTFFVCLLLCTEFVFIFCLLLLSLFTFFVYFY